MEDDKLTIEELKQIDGYENCSDIEAEKMIGLVYQFSILAWKYYNEENNKDKKLSKVAR